MTVFSSSYCNRHLQETTMADIEILIQNEENKTAISNAIYERFYERYIKIFLYD